MEEVLAPSGSIHHTYDVETGKLITLTSPDATLDLGWDGPLLEEVRLQGDVSWDYSLEYDEQLRPLSQTLNGQPWTEVEFGYDDDDLVTAVTIGGSSTLNLDYDPETGFLNGTSLDRISDSVEISGFGEVDEYRVTSAGEGGGDPLEFFRQDFTRDRLGRITEVTETLRDSLGGPPSMRTHEYDYDLDGRLREVKRNGAVSATYVWDDNGNRLAWTDDHGTALGFYDTQDRLTSTTDTVYSYGPNGELRARAENGQLEAFQYDVFGNLTAVVLADGRLIEYLVDGQNRRIGKKIDGQLVSGWAYKDHLAPIAELEPDGSVRSLFIYGSSGIVPDAMLRGGVLYRYVTDWRGSIRMVVDATTGTVVQELDYDAFGRVQLDTNPGWQPFGYAGGLYDGQTGLVRFGARDYDPRVGRWTAKDPIGFEGGDTNLYAYVGDPVNLTAPEGLAVPLIALAKAVWVSAEVGLSMYDFVEMVKVFVEPGSSLGQKALASGMFVAGVIGVGGGAVGAVGGARRTFKRGRQRSKGIAALDTNALIRGLEGGSLRGSTARSLAGGR